MFNLRAPWHGKGRNYTVRTKSFHEWFRGLRFTAEDKVYIKMDVEGSEFEVFEHFLTRPEMCLVDWWAIEWHPSQAVTSRIAQPPPGKTAEGFVRDVMQQFRSRVTECNQERSTPIVVARWT